MISRDNPGARSPRTPAYLMMGIFLVALWIAGGASRADAAGQIFAQGAAWLLLLGFVVWAPLPKLRPFAPIAFILLGCIALAAAQLVPLPPALWMSLPGRDLLAQTAVVTGQEQPWRPLSMSPGATANALASLIVPTLALVLAVSVLPEEKWRTATLLLCLVFASAILALLQFSGGNFDHPLINDVPGSVSGSFANRNHLALFIAIGCVLAPSWGFRGERSARWKGPVSIALLLFFGLIVLATGSRMGLLLGALGAAIGLMNVRRELRAVLRRQPRWLGIAVIAGVLVLAATAVLLSVT